MNTTEHILHIASLNNNCPVCYATDGLEISFAQEERETKFFVKTDKTVIETLYCKSCKNIIYPVNWTEDIDRIYDYHKKQAIPKSSKVRLKPISYGIILVAMLLLASIIFAVSSL